MLSPLWEMVCVCAPRWPVVELTSGSRECLLGCRIHTGDPAPQKSTWWGSGASVSHRRCKYSHSLRDRGDCGHRLQGALWRVGGCCTPKGSPLAVTPADSREAGWALLADFYPKSKRHTGQGPLNPHLLVQGLLVPLTSLHLLEACSAMRTSVV